MSRRQENVIKDGVISIADTKVEELPTIQQMEPKKIRPSTSWLIRGKSTELSFKSPMSSTKAFTIKPVTDKHEFYTLFHYRAHLGHDLVGH